MRNLATIVLGSITGVIHAETHAVLPGGSVQEKIDVAVDGDIVAIFGGIYNENLTITKRIRLVELSGQEVTLGGNLTFSGIENCPPLEGFTIGSNGDKNIIISDTTGLVISEVDHTAGNSIVINGESTVEIKDCSLNNLDPDDGILKISDSSLSGRVEQGGGIAEMKQIAVGGDVVQESGSLDLFDSTVGGDISTGRDAVKTVAFRTTVTGDCNWRSNRSWFGYGKARSFNFYGSDAKVVFVGGEIDRLGSRVVGMNLEGGKNEYTVVNSYIHNVGAYSNYNNESNCIEISGVDHMVEILNNYFSTNHAGSSGSQHTIELGNDVKNAKIIGNVFREDHPSSWTKAVFAPFGVLVEGNLWAGIEADGHDFLVEGGVSLGKNNIRAHHASLFVDGDPYDVAEGSPAIDAGTEDARYNDRDGTRNNIGPSGGSWYDPEGWTTEKPVVISFDLTPDQVLEGVNTEVTIDDVRAVSGQ